MVLGSSRLRPGPGRVVPWFGTVGVKVDLFIRPSWWVPFGWELDQFDNMWKRSRPFREFGGSSTVRGPVVSSIYKYGSRTNYRDVPGVGDGCSETVLVTEIWTLVPDSLSRLPSGTVCVGVRPVRRHVGVGPGLFVKTSDEDRPSKGPFGSSHHGCRVRTLRRCTR